MADDVRLEIDRLDSPVATQLVAEQQLELQERYGSPDPDPDQLDAAQLSASGGGFFVVAWRGDQAIACGGLRRYDGTTAEIKRMYTVPRERRAGVGRAVLAEIESVALDLGYARLVLETGIEQPDAINLYMSSGYEPIECYGVYKDFPQSRCFAKQL
jgi:GNAT superfamily N-acetyltransferase